MTEMAHELIITAKQMFPGYQAGMLEYQQAANGMTESADLLESIWYTLRSLCRVDYDDDGEAEIAIRNLLHSIHGPLRQLDRYGFGCPAEIMTGRAAHEQAAWLRDHPIEL